MLFCQMGSAHSLREICGGLATALGKLVHLGVRRTPTRSTLAYANAHRPWRLYESLFYQVLGRCQALAATKQRRFRFKNPLRTLDATVIELCAAVFDCMLIMGSGMIIDFKRDRKASGSNTDFDAQASGGHKSLQRHHFCLIDRLVPLEPLVVVKQKMYRESFLTPKLRDALAVRTEIPKEIGGTGFGEILGSEEVQFDGRIDLPFHLGAQAGPLFKVHDVDGEAEGCNIDIAVLACGALHVRSEHIRLQNRNAGLHQREGSLSDRL
jgi:hypothetical protein